MIEICSHYEEITNRTWYHVIDRNTNQMLVYGAYVGFESLVKIYNFNIDVIRWDYIEHYKARYNNLKTLITLNDINDIKKLDEFLPEYFI